VAERISFYMDEHVPKAVAQGLRRRGVDVLRAQEVDMTSADDLRHLELASREHRVIFTQDADFLRLHNAGVAHCGILYAPQQMPIGRVVRGLMLICDVLSPQDMANHVEFL
jgi:hypothetical protein